MKKSHYPLIALLVCATIVFLLVVGAYAINFWEFKVSASPEHWGQLGDYIGGVLNPLLSLCALAAVLLTFRHQMKELAEANAQTERSTSAAVQATEISRTTMVASNRAHLVMNGPRWISHHEIDSGKVFWRISVGWVNRGKTPAMSCRIVVRPLLSPVRLSGPKELDWKQEEAVNILSVSPGAVIESNVRDCWGSELAQIQSGKQFLYIWGWCDYRDVFDGTPARRTQFAFESSQLSGDPETLWDEKSPMNLHLIHFGSANLVDEDCLVFARYDLQ